LLGGRTEKPKKVDAQNHDPYVVCSEVAVDKGIAQARIIHLLHCQPKLFGLQRTGNEPGIASAGGSDAVNGYHRHYEHKGDYW
jgi:hypothetical protein